MPAQPRAIAAVMRSMPPASARFETALSYSVATAMLASPAGTYFVRMATGTPPFSMTRSSPSTALSASPRCTRTSVAGIPFLFLTIHGY